MTRPTIDRRIFVVGVPRSGTTLVQSLLAAHSRVTSFTESHLFSRHFTLLAGGSRAMLVRDPGPRLLEFLGENEAGPVPGPVISPEDLARVSPPVLVRPLRTRAVARQLVQVFDNLAGLRSREIWVEKTCRHLRYAPYLDRLLGPTQRPHFVHVIRNGLEVVSSLHAASQHWERPYDVAECARRWNADVTFSLGRADAPNDHFVFYEDLTANPEDTLARLLSALGLSWEADLLAAYPTAARRLVTRAESWKGSVGREIRRSETSHRLLTSTERMQGARLLDGELYARVHERTMSRRMAG